MNYQSVLLFVAAILVLFFNFFVYLKNKKSKVNLTFATFGFFISLWLFSFAIAYNIVNLALKLFWFKIGYIGITFIPCGFYAFIFFLLERKKDKFIVFFNYILGVCFVILNFSCLPLITGLYKYPWGYYPRASLFLHPIFLLFFNSLFTFSIINLLFAFLRKDSKFNAIQRIRIKYILFGSIFGVMGTVDYFGNYGINVFPFGFVFMLIYPIILTYAIVRYRLMDITLAVTRTGIFVAVYSLVLGIPFVIAYGMQARLIAIFGNQWWIIPLISSTVLATAGPFIYLYIQKRAEDRLLREQRAYQSTLRQASTGMNRIRDLHKLLNLIVHVVTRTVRLKNGAVYLFDENKNSYILQAVRDRGKGKVGMVIPAKSALIQKLLVEREPLVYEEIKQRLQDYQDSSLADVEAQMKQIDAAVVVPSFAGEGLVGFIVLGEKMSGKLYSQDDLVVFSVLANQAALAIENAKFYEDVKKTQEQLFQAEKMATIGTMANGLSHQISNRLQALGFIAGDTLDTLKLAWDKPYPQDIKELLNTIKNALERVQDNVKQGGEVVKGMLKYSRPGDAGFEPINLDQLVTASLEMAQYKVKLSYIDVVREFSQDLSPVRGNFTQLQEVFFNLIDNAYDATMQRKDELHEPDYKGKITISAAVADSTMEIRFSDNGVGVKAEDMSKIFTPFFTTKTSSKKGTGLGLYVIQKIITGHNGTIHVESRYKEVTTFIIELPLSRT